MRIVTWIIVLIIFFISSILYVFGDLSPWDLSLSENVKQLNKHLTIIFLVGVALNLLIIIYLRIILNKLQEIKNHYKVEVKDNKPKGILKYWKIYDTYSLDEREKRKKLIIIIAGYTIFVSEYFITTSSRYDLKIQGYFMQLDEKISWIYIVLLTSVFVFVGIHEILKVIKKISNIINDE